MDTNRRKAAIFRVKSKLARLLQCLLHQGPMIRSAHQGVSTMSIVKIHNAAFALLGAVIFAGLFVGAAVPVVPVA
jgi:hypothetical protein